MTLKGAAKTSEPLVGHRRLDDLSLLRPPAVCIYILMISPPVRYLKNLVPLASLLRQTLNPVRRNNGNPIVLRFVAGISEAVAIIGCEEGFLGADCQPVMFLIVAEPLGGKLAVRRENANTLGRKVIPEKLQQGNDSGFVEMGNEGAAPDEVESCGEAKTLKRSVRENRLSGKASGTKIECDGVDFGAHDPGGWITGAKESRDSSVSARQVEDCVDRRAGGRSLDAANSGNPHFEIMPTTTRQVHVVAVIHLQGDSIKKCGFDRCDLGRFGKTVPREAKIGGFDVTADEGVEKVHMATHCTGARMSRARHGWMR